jgi:3-ketosteroid 9alpha-monooxygenase subunit B
MALQFHELAVTAVIDETADSRSYVFAVPEELRAQFAYRAGQFLTFEIPWEGGFSIKRCYSLSSAPDLDGAPRITIKRVAGGRMSNWMLDNVTVGQILRVAPPDGRFVLDPAAGARPLTLFGGGSGITPLISIAKTALATTERHVKLLYANRDVAATILRAELEALAAAHPARLEIHHHRDCDAGFLTAESIRAHLQGREHGDHYVCGPAPFMELVSQALESAEIPTERRFFERFISALDPDRRKALAQAAAERKKVPREFVVRLDGAAHTVPYEPGMTLLAAAQKAGVPAPSSCEDGICGSCKAQLVRGNVTMREQTALEPFEREAGKILLCQSLAASPDALEVECARAALKPEPTASAAGAPPQPLLRRILSALFVMLVFALFFWVRSQP